MKSPCVAERPNAVEPVAEIACRRRQINSDWTPFERGRRLLLAAARQAELYTRIGLDQLAPGTLSLQHGYGTPRSSPTKASSR
jgi:hypothetical protein